jgi:hypothetical protein
MKRVTGYINKQRILVLFFLGSFSAVVLAIDIQGIAGYRLGEILDKTLVLTEAKEDGGAVVYRVKMLASEPLVELLTVRITTQQQIHRISAYSPVLTEKDCQTRMTELRIQTEKQFPKLGYYAMADGELFYQDDRTYTLDCARLDGAIRLRQEYSDDKLAAQSKKG